MHLVPVIGITTHSLHAVTGVSDGQPPGFAVGQAYVRALGAAGALAWPIPLIPEDPEMLESLVGHIDGLLIPGGTDLDPIHYGEDRHPAVERPDGPRDLTELALIRMALDRGLPVLGICRGMQTLNVAAGGTLYQHVAGGVKHDYYDRSIPRDHLAHSVHMQGDSRVYRVVRTDQMPVNSLHHQAVRTLGDGLVATGFAPDGLVEAMEIPEHPYAVGVQWHPEELVASDDRMLGVFVDFVKVAMGERKMISVGGS